MPIRGGKSILEGSKQILRDADVIQTANVIGHCFGRMLRKQVAHFETEGDELLLLGLHPGPHDQQAWVDAQRAQFIERCLLAEMVRLVMNVVVKGSRISEGEVRAWIAPPKEILPTIFGGEGLDDDQMSFYAKAAADYCEELGDGPYPTGVGYRGQGAYTGVVRRLIGEPLHKHFSTTRWALRAADDYATRWHPEPKHWENGIGGMKPIGNGDGQRVYGMQATNQAQVGIERDQHMLFSGAAPEVGDVVGYTHGLPLAIVGAMVVQNETGVAGIPMEVVGGSNTDERYKHLTKKGASCFQCAVYMESCGFAASSVHVGRGESWIPPYPEHYEEGDPMRAQAAVCLEKYYQGCLSNLTLGMKLLVESGGVLPSHQASFELLNKTLMENLGDGAARKAAELVLDASAVHDKDFERVLRTLCPEGELAATRNDAKARAADAIK